MFGNELIFSFCFDVDVWCMCIVVLKILKFCVGGSGCCVFRVFYRLQYVEYRLMYLLSLDRCRVYVD